MRKHRKFNMYVNTPNTNRSYFKTNNLLIKFLLIVVKNRRHIYFRKISIMDHLIFLTKKLTCSFSWISWQFIHGLLGIVIYWHIPLSNTAIYWFKLTNIFTKVYLWIIVSLFSLGNFLRMYNLSTHFMIVLTSYDTTSI